MNAVTDMKIHEINGYISRLYLIEYRKGLLLLDSGCRPDVKTVTTVIEKTLARPLEDLKLVVVTHAHPDHMGGAYAFRRLGVPIAGQEASNLWYQGLSGKTKYLIDILLTWYVALKTRRYKKFQNVFFKPSVKFDYELKDQDPLPIFNDWQVLECPGHTHCDLSLFNREQNLAYVADNLIGLKQKVIRPYPLTHPDLYKTSLQKYLDLGIENFLLAHYGQRQVSRQTIENLIQTTPTRPRNHRNSLLKKLTHFTLIFVLLTAGCSISIGYRTQKLESQLAEVDKRIQIYNARVEQDFTDKSQGFLLLVRSGADTTRSPYPELKSQLRIMKKEKENYVKIRSLYLQDKKNMQLHIAGKNEVDSSDPAYPTIQRWKNSRKRFLEKVQPVTASYSKASKRFMQLLQRHKIYEVSYQSLKMKVNSSLDRITAQYRMIKRLYHQSIMEPQNSHQELLQRLDDSMDKIEALMAKSKQVVREFQLEVANLDSGLMAPHMQSYSIETQMKKYSELLKSEVRKIKKRLKSF